MKQAKADLNAKDEQFDKPGQFVSFWYAPGCLLKIQDASLDFPSIFWQPAGDEQSESFFTNSPAFQNYSYALNLC